MPVLVVVFIVCTCWLKSRAVAQDHDWWLAAKLPGTMCVQYMPLEIAVFSPVPSATLVLFVLFVGMHGIPGR